MESIYKIIKALLWSGLAILQGLALVGCAGFNVSHEPLSSERFAAKSNSAFIEVYTTYLPTRSFIEIARVEVRGKSNVETWHGAMEELKSRARQLGADALVRTDIAKGPPGMIGPGAIKATAIAIRWK